MSSPCEMIVDMSGQQLMVVGGGGLRMDVLPKGSPVILSQRPLHRLPGAQAPDAAHWNAKRAQDDADFPDLKRRCKGGGEKGSKGLRHFSMKVCEKVQRKGTTSYNEVADELVAEFATPEAAGVPPPRGGGGGGGGGGSGGPADQAYDQKNIRRRVYDALNVLMAMNIISKEKKEIRWLGLPTNSAQECQRLEKEKQRRLEQIAAKRQQLYDLLLQQIAYKNLVERNRALEHNRQGPAPASTIPLPFIIINTNKQTVIDCSISSDKSEYLFHFDNTFEIHDDIEVLKRMGLALGLDKGSCSQDDLERARRMVPRSLEPYVLQMAQAGSEVVAKPSEPQRDSSRHSSVASLSDGQPGSSEDEEDFSDSD